MGYKEKNKVFSRCLLGVTHPCESLLLARMQGFVVTRPLMLNGKLNRL